jgi:hypothetical protein
MDYVQIDAHHDIYNNANAYNSIRRGISDTATGFNNASGRRKSHEKYQRLGL